MWRPCSQPHGPFSLGIMEAFLWFLTSLSHAGNGQPFANRSQQTRSDTLTHWIIEFYTQESHPRSWPGSPAPRGPDRNSPRISISSGERVPARPCGCVGMRGGAVHTLFTHCKHISILALEFGTAVPSCPLLLFCSPPLCATNGLMDFAAALFICRLCNR